VKKTSSGIMLLLILSFVLVSLLQIVVAQAVEDQSYQTITIKPDGSVEPDTDLLERNGTTYTFKGDIFGTIMVQKDNIIIDGEGHTLRGRKEVGTVDERGIYLVGPDMSWPYCRNVLVKNLRICNFWRGIFVGGSGNNSIIGNYLENAGIHLFSSENYMGDLIKHNTFNGSVIFVDYNTAGLDVITENNFFNSWIGVGLSVAPIVEKNYWSDYNGTDSNGDGIGDTPYISQINGLENVQDDYPLIAPLDIEVIPEFPSWTPMLIMLIAVLAVAVIYRRRLHTKLQHVGN
jgi:hypothetical protein